MYISHSLINIFCSKSPGSLFKLFFIGLPRTQKIKHQEVFVALWKLSIYFILTVKKACSVFESLLSLKPANNCVIYPACDPCWSQTHNSLVERQKFQRHQATSLYNLNIYKIVQRCKIVLYIIAYRRYLVLMPLVISLMQNMLKESSSCITVYMSTKVGL